MSMSALGSSRRGAIQCYLAMAALLVVSSLIEIPPTLEMAKRELPADITEVQAADITRTLVKIRTAIAIGTPVYYAMLLVLQGLIFWAVLTIITGKTVKPSRVIAAGAYAFGVVVVGRILRSIFLLVSCSMGSTDAANANPFGFSFASSWLPGSPILKSSLARLDAFAVLYVAMLVVAYSRVFQTRKAVTSAVVIPLSLIWFYLQGIVGSIGENLRAD